MNLDISDLIGPIFAIITSVGGTWFAFVRSTPNRDEVKSMIKTECPYLEDKRFILSTIEMLQDNQKYNTVVNEKLGNAIHELQITIGKLQVTLEQANK